MTTTLTSSKQVHPRTAAKIAGVSYIGLFVLGVFTNFLVLEGLTESGDPAATVANIRASEGLFRAGLVGFLVIFALDVVVAWALHIIFRPVNRDLSLLAAWLRLVYTTLLGVASVFLFLVLELVTGADYLSAFDPAQSDAQAMLYLQASIFTWLIGLFLFGGHLITIGCLILKSGNINKLLGWVLVLAGTGYVIDTLGRALLGTYDDHATVFLLIVAIPAVIGEFAMTVWLLLRAGKSPA